MNISQGRFKYLQCIEQFCQPHRKAICDQQPWGLCYYPKVWFPLSATTVHYCKLHAALSKSYSRHLTLMNTPFLFLANLSLPVPCFIQVTRNLFATRGW